MMVKKLSKVQIAKELVSPNRRYRLLFDLSIPGDVSGRQKTLDIDIVAGSMDEGYARVKKMMIDIPEITELREFYCYRKHETNAIN